MREKDRQKEKALRVEVPFLFVLVVMKEAIKKALKEAAIFLIKAIASAGIAEILHLIFG